ncbi:unnamed protein product [Tilletia laevis]|nr:hypothetical protein CF335_g4999 [Tilletia laevis]KAE8259775.1 hypothetical protein A4X03_0g3996 [Tilletia caries]CAD6891837.1 unnamed protein product [Tilletia caries]CAD6960068.1 unnamed protein product [Tilletia laevis]CAD7061250.1 unnamed protein product [Tilletia caries]
MRLLFVSLCAWLLLLLSLSPASHADARAPRAYNPGSPQGQPPRTVTAEYMASTYPLSRAGISTENGRQGSFTDVLLTPRTFLDSVLAVRPKILIVNMFALEASVWLEQFSPSLYSRNITVPGLSPVFPQVHCTAKADVCQVTTGEGQINAAATMSALFLSSKFDLRKTYFFIAGVGGISPERGTLGSAAFARYAIQVAQQYALDRNDAPPEWNYTYWNYNTKQPDEYPLLTYGTEVFKLNTALVERAYNVSKTQAERKLNDSAEAQAYRSRYPNAPANEGPKVILGDVTTSDLYFTGRTLSMQFENVVTTLTNGSATYTTTAQEDNATLEALVRAQRAGKADYSRAIVLRTGSDFERAPPGLSEYDAFGFAQGGFGPASANTYIASLPVVEDILQNWNTVYRRGIPPPTQGFYGDIWQTLRLQSGQAPPL